MEFVLGALFVMVYAIRRFSLFTDDEFPAPPRLCTTAFRYYRSLYMYAAWSVILFLILSLVPTAILIATLAGETGLEKTLPPVAIGVLLLTLALPKFPILRDVDDSIRNWLLDLAQIPSRARAIRSWILGAAFQSPPREDQTAPDADDVPALEALGTTPERRKAIAELLRAGGMYRALDNEPVFSSFATIQSKALNGLKGRLDAIKKTLLAMPAPGQPGTPEIESAAALECSKAHTEAATLLSQAILKSGRSEESSRLLLGGIGFSSERKWPEDARDVTDVIALVVLVVFLGLLITLILTSGESIRSGTDNPAVKALMISLVYAAAFGVPAVLIHMRAGGDERGREKHCNIGLYVLASCLAVATDLAIRWVFKLMVFSVKDHSMTVGAIHAWDDLQAKFGYSLLTIVNSLITAIVLDMTNPLTAPKWRRWAEGAAYALVNFGAGMLVLEVLGTNGPTTPQPVFLAILGTLGFVLGTLVPSLYRDRVLGARREEKAEEKPEPRPPVAPRAVPRIAG